jgi:hypothetical protein
MKLRIREACFFFVDVVDEAEDTGSLFFLSMSSMKLRMREACFFVDVVDEGEDAGGLFFFCRCRR